MNRRANAANTMPLEWTRTPMRAPAGADAGRVRLVRSGRGVARELSGTLGKYSILEKIGEGGMGQVYTAWDPTLRRRVALKVMLCSEAGRQERDRFEAEMQSLAGLSHPNVVTVHDFCDDGTICFAVMEHLEGATLRAALETGALPIAECLRIGRQIAEGLAAAHERHIVHRDVKPENILITGRGLVKLIDFGLSQQVEPCERLPGLEASDEPTALVGTLAYMSPEQAKGIEVDFRSDIFAFGTVVYEMLTGNHPFAAHTAEDTLAAIRSGRPPRARQLPELSARLMRITARCLRKSPSRRYASMRAVAGVMERLHREALSSEPASNTRRRRRSRGGARRRSA